MLRKIIIPATNDLLFVTSIVILLAVSGFLIDTFELLIFPVSAGNKASMAMTVILFWGLKYIVLFFASVLGWLFFRKRKTFPKIFIIWLLVVSTGSLIYLVLWISMPMLRMNIPIFHPSSPTLLVYPITAFILFISWSLYFKKPRRFKSTFAHKLSQADIVFFIFTSILTFLFTASYLYKDMLIVKGFRLSQAIKTTGEL